MKTTKKLLFLNRIIILCKIGVVNNAHGFIMAKLENNICIITVSVQKTKTATRSLLKQSTRRKAHSITHSLCNPTSHKSIYPNILLHIYTSAHCRLYYLVLLHCKPNSLELINQYSDFNALNVIIKHKNFSKMLLKPTRTHVLSTF